MIAAALRMALTILAPTTAGATGATAVYAGHIEDAIVIVAFAALALILWAVVHEMRAADNPRRSVRLHHHHR